MLVKEREIGFERALTDPEDVAPLATDNLADELASATGAAHDLLDGNAIARKLHDRGVGLLPSQVSILLELLGAGEQGGRLQTTLPRESSRECRALHRTAIHGVRWALTKMPAVGDLRCIGRTATGALSINAGTIASDDLDARIAFRP